MNKEKTYEIRAGWLSNEKIGDLFVGSGNRKDVLAFAYDDHWLDQHSKFVLDLNLYPFSGRQFCNNGLFSFLQDASPDRWGRNLLKYVVADNYKQWAGLANISRSEIIKMSRIFERGLS